MDKHKIAIACASVIMLILIVVQYNTPTGKEINDPEFSQE